MLSRELTFAPKLGPDEHDSAQRTLLAFLIDMLNSKDRAALSKFWREEAAGKPEWRGYIANLIDETERPR